MRSGSRHRGSDLFPIAALAADALARPLSALGHALREEGRSALRAGLGHRSRPGDEFALGVLVARVERLAALAPPLHELASAAGFGAHDAEGDGRGGLALWIAGAGEELAEATPLLDHGLAAIRTGLAGLLADLVVRHARLRLANVPVELPVELAHHLDPIAVAFFDLVERLLELGGEVQVHDLGKERH